MIIICYDAPVLETGDRTVKEKGTGNKKRVYSMADSIEYQPHLIVVKLHEITYGKWLLESEPDL